jgi:hypothetical protein
MKISILLSVSWVLWRLSPLHLSVSSNTAPTLAEISVFVRHFIKCSLREVNTVCTKTHHPSVSWARWIRSTPPSYSLKIHLNSESPSAPRFYKCFKVTNVLCSTCFRTAFWNTGLQSNPEVNYFFGMTSSKWYDYDWLYACVVREIYFIRANYEQTKYCSETFQYWSLDRYLKVT